MQPHSKAQLLKAARLRSGDRIRIVSPSSPPDRISVEQGARAFSKNGDCGSSTVSMPSIDMVIF
jgi:hypothetical protein